MKAWRFILFAFLAAQGAAAQLVSLAEELTLDPPAFLVKDIATAQGPDNPIGRWNFELLGGIYYFPAYDGSHGVELWRTDGTPGGTWMVKDICPGFCSGFLTRLVRAGDFVYFSAHDGDSGSELWRSDGTSLGTTLVDDLIPGGGGSGPSQLTALGDRILFQAATGSGLEIWGSDGTAPGTELLVSVPPLPPGNSQQCPIVVVGTLAFVGTPTSLWKTDGTTAGSELVANVGVQPDSSLTFNRSVTAVALGNVLLFTAASPSSTLWRSDGTELGTFQVHTVSGPFWYLEYQGEVYFSGPCPVKWCMRGDHGLGSWQI